MVVIRFTHSLCTEVTDVMKATFRAVRPLTKTIGVLYYDGFTVGARQGSCLEALPFFNHLGIHTEGACKIPWDSRAKRMINKEIAFLFHPCTIAKASALP